MNQDLTTLICLFHQPDAADSAREDLIRANVPEHSVTLIGRNASHPDALAALSELGLPSRDVHHLLNGLEHGGVVLTVDSVSHLVDKVEAIFRAHAADPVSETVVSNAQGEERRVGDRRASEGQGDSGWLHVVHGTRERPVSEEVALPDKKIRFDGQSEEDSVIELTETREELVVTKAPHVIEEVVVNRESAARVEHLREMVSKTEIEVEQIAPGADGKAVESRELAHS